jgi:pyruvate/2-oxoglutarate dehydrogenase complex dihydrolipoamide acyltransferase (E2) component
MATPVTMPRLGESVAEGTIGSWLKNEGDLVEKDEAIAEIITDKINAELPSPVAGRLTKIIVQTDETVAVGTDIALIEESADIAVAPDNAAPHPAPGPDAAPVQSTAQGTRPVISTGSSTNGYKRTIERVLDGEEEERQRISPLARRLARDNGVDLRDIVGTGAGGRVRKEDILAYVAQHQPGQGKIAATVLDRPAMNGTEHPAKVVTPSVAAAPVAPVIAADDEIIVPDRMRLAIAEHMVRSKRTSPHATTVVEVDMTNIARWLERNKAEFKRREGYGISFVPFVMKAVCEGIRKFPIINSTWTPENTIVIKKHINLGVAVATETGLVVPTIYDADQYTLAGLARQVAQIAQRARANKLTVQDLQNSTFVVNNPGVFGTIISMPIINQPHAGILSTDAVVKRPVVIEDDAIAVRHMMYMSLSFDHRVLDGAGAGGFLQVVRTRLQSYGREIDVY